MWKKVDLKRKLILLPGKKKEKEPFLKIQPVSISFVHRISLPDRRIPPQPTKRQEKIEYRLWKAEGGTGG